MNGKGEQRFRNENEKLKNDESDVYVCDENGVYSACDDPNFLPIHLDSSCFFS